jgi:hypothetical protein
MASSAILTAIYTPMRLGRGGKNTKILYQSASNIHVVRNKKCHGELKRSNILFYGESPNGEKYEDVKNFDTAIVNTGSTGHGTRGYRNT